MNLINYEVLRLIWWLLLGVLLIGFAVTDGFDLGVATLLPFVGRTDVERRVVINTIGPVWEGNQVWLILGGGAIFAAWPPLYAVSFSGFYLAMFAILAALILRPVGFKYRSKRDSEAWRKGWDWALFVGGFVPALIFGVAVGKTLQGVPFRLDEDLRIFYDGTFFGLINPFALLCGLLSVAMLVTHGATWLQHEADGAVADRARALAASRRWWRWCCSCSPVCCCPLRLGYRITSPINPLGPSNPLLKTRNGRPRRVVRQFMPPRRGCWWPPRWASLECSGGARPAPEGGGAGCCFRPRHLRHHQHGGGVHVPLHPALDRGCALQPDGVGCLVQPISPCSSCWSRP